jgi:hypothetical protein
MATAKLFWRVEPARDPRAITVLWRERVFVLTELSVSAFVHVSALLAPDVNTKFVGTRVERAMILSGDIKVGTQASPHPSLAEMA